MAVPQRCRDFNTQLKKQAPVLSLLSGPLQMQQIIVLTQFDYSSHLIFFCRVASNSDSFWCSRIYNAKYYVIIYLEYSTIDSSVDFPT